MNTGMSNLTGGLILRGVLAVLFGIAAVFWPGLTLVTLLYLFATFLLVGGLVELVMGVAHIGSPETSGWTKILVLLLGVLQLGVGVYLLRHPKVTFATFILLIGFTLIFRGVFEVVQGLFDEGSATYRTIMIIVGLLAALAGIVVLFQPEASGVAFVWIIGLYALITGPLMIAAAMDAHRLDREVTVHR
jgi:uncharacterized membrane protein HdeD (DUF308 family)